MIGLVAPPVQAKPNTDAQFIGLHTLVLSTLDHVEQIKFKLGYATGDDVEILEDQLQEARHLYQEYLWRLAQQLGNYPGKTRYTPEISMLLNKEFGYLQRLVISTKELIDTYHIRLLSYENEFSPDRLVVKVNRRYDILTDSYSAILSNIKAKNWLNLATEEDTKLVLQWVQDEADLLVGRAELVSGRIKNYKRQISIYQPDSEGYQLTQTKIKGQQLQLDYVTKHLSYIARLVGRLGQDASGYQEALIRITGRLSEDVLDVKVIRRLLIQWKEDTKQWLLIRGPEILGNIASFVFILLIAWVVARMFQGFLRKTLARPEVGFTTLARDFLLSISSKLIILIGLVIALGNVGVELGPILAGVGILGFIIGFALQDTLSNFASGLMILIYRPYDVGDYIEAAGVKGTVRRMSLVATTIYTVENHRLMLPNNKVWGNIIRNVTSQHVRRVDMMFGVSYDDDIDHVKKVLDSILEQHEKVLKSPEWVIRVHELADSSVNFVVRPWVPSADYWEVYWDLTEQVKKRFDLEGISIPYPQQDIRLANNHLPAPTS